jgi:hypothetical protein
MDGLELLESSGSWIMRLRSAGRSIAINGESGSGDFLFVEQQGGGSLQECLEFIVAFLYCGECLVG